jgi:hypothetical protein
VRHPVSIPRPLACRFDSCRPLLLLLTQTSPDRHPLPQAARLRLHQRVCGTAKARVAEGGHTIHPAPECRLVRHKQPRAAHQQDRLAGRARVQGLGGPGLQHLRRAGRRGDWRRRRLHQGLGDYPRGALRLPRNRPLGRSARDGALHLDQEAEPGLRQGRRPCHRGALRDAHDLCAGPRGFLHRALLEVALGGARRDDHLALPARHLHRSALLHLYPSPGCRVLIWRVPVL